MTEAREVSSRTSMMRTDHHSKYIFAAYIGFVFNLNFIKEMVGGWHNLHFFIHFMVPIFLQTKCPKVRPGPDIIKLFSCSTHLSIKFILPINVKMPTTVRILTNMDSINTASESLKQISYLFQHFSFMSS